MCQKHYSQTGKWRPKVLPNPFLLGCLFWTLVVSKYSLGSDCTHISLMNLEWDFTKLCHSLIYVLAQTVGPGLSLNKVWGNCDWSQQIKYQIACESSALQMNLNPQTPGNSVTSCTQSNQSGAVAGGEWKQAGSLTTVSVNVADSPSQCVMLGGMPSKHKISHPCGFGDGWHPLFSKPHLILHCAASSSKPSSNGRSAPSSRLACQSLRWIKSRSVFAVGPIHISSLKQRYASLFKGRLGSHQPRRHYLNFRSIWMISEYLLGTYFATRKGNLFPQTTRCG